MAKLFDKTEFAKEKLKEADQRFEAMRLELASAYTNGKLPTLQITIPQSASEAKKDKSIWVFGKNSLPFYAAQQLDVEVISPEKTSQFGTAQLGLGDLMALQTDNGNDLCRVYLSSYQTSNPTDESIEPRDGCSFNLSYQNAFGGFMSVLNFSEAIHQALLQHRNKI